MSGLAASGMQRIPVLRPDDVVRPAADMDIWDAWPLADDAGRPVAWRGGELWFALAAPAHPDPEARHDEARIHHFHRTAGGFFHLGRTLPETVSPGSREWSGAARLDEGMVSLYFTAAGQRGEAEATFRQRLFRTRAALMGDAAQAVFGDWSLPDELLAGGGHYLSADEDVGVAGDILAFRDPFPWRASDGREYLLFSGSCPQTASIRKGMAGLAVLCGEARGYVPLEPLVDACGFCNELERPHLVAHGERLYLFWSSQAKVFAPDAGAPTGLYGATAQTIEGPWQLLNGHGLVLANPEREPFQCYAWLVLPDLSVTSFVDYWGVNDHAASEKPVGRHHFGGTMAPFVQIALDGAAARLV